MLFRVASTAALAATAAATLSTYKPVHRSASDFDWDTLTPSASLHFSPCYDEYECARLIVPLDWPAADAAASTSRRNDTHATMAIALTRLRANMTDGDNVKHGGTVIINPGGPGDSGVVDMLVNGHYLRDLMATNTTRFDVMSFDPRGMAFSAPAADCFAGEEAGRVLFTAEMAGVDAMSVTGEDRDEVLTPKRALLRAYGEKCNVRGDDGYVVAAYMSTTSVARDMLLMVDELEKLRAAEEKTEVQPRPRLQYFGTSYGTMLGNTFMSMFPGRVKRMVLDGNVVPEDYTAADWSGDMVDVAKVVDNFYATCFDVKSACALYDAAVDTCPDDIRAKVDALTASLTASPAIVAGPHQVPSIIKGSTVRSLFLGALYAPLGNAFPMLASLLAESVAGNLTTLAAALQIPQTGLCDNNQVAAPSKYAWQPEAGTAVRCGDGADVRNTTNDAWRATLADARRHAPDWWVDFWMGAQLQCREWPVRPNWRFTGPYGSPAADASGKTEGAPLAPALFLASRFDPATPLVNTVTAAKEHAGARVVVQNTYGHCATLSAPSECTKNIVGKYMATGEMPAEGTECEPSCKPFEECPYLRMLLPW